MVRLPRGAIFEGVMCFSLFMCSTSLSRRANALLHTSHTYGFSPENKCNKINKYLGTLENEV